MSTKTTTQHHPNEHDSLDRANNMSTAHEPRPARPSLLKRLSLDGHHVEIKSTKVNTPPLHWTPGLTPITGKGPAEDKEEKGQEERTTQ